MEMIVMYGAMAIALVVVIGLVAGSDSPKGQLPPEILASFELTPDPVPGSEGILQSYRSTGIDPWTDEDRHMAAVIDRLESLNPEENNA